MVFSGDSPSGQKRFFCSRPGAQTAAISCRRFAANAPRLQGTVLKLSLRDAGRDLPILPLVDRQHRCGLRPATALGRRYRKIATRQEWSSFSANFPPVALPALPPAVHCGASASRSPAAGGSGPKPGPRSGRRLHDRVADFGSQLTEADERLRQCAASPDVGTIEAVLSESKPRPATLPNRGIRPNSGWPTSARRGDVGRHPQRTGRRRTDAGRGNQGHLPGNRQLRL